jgi:hypothetical protein
MAGFGTTGFGTTGSGTSIGAGMTAGGPAGVTSAGLAGATSAGMGRTGVATAAGSGVGGTPTGEGSGRGMGALGLALVEAPVAESVDSALLPQPASARSGRMEATRRRVGVVIFNWGFSSVGG